MFFCGPWRAQEAFLPEYSTFVQNDIGFFAVDTELFLVEIDLGMVDKKKPKEQTPPKKKQKNMFWGLLGSGHVQTSLENSVCFLFLFLCCFNFF